MKLIYFWEGRGKLKEKVRLKEKKIEKKRGIKSKKKKRKGKNKKRSEGKGKKNTGLIDCRVHLHTGDILTQYIL